MIGKLNELTTQQADMESGERGYVVTGDESFLAPYQLAKPQLGVQLDDLIHMTADNPVQTDRLKRVRSLQTAWELYAQQIIDLRREGGDATAVVKSSAAKQLSDRVRTEVLAARASEQSLLRIASTRCNWSPGSASARTSCSSSSSTATSPGPAGATSSSCRTTSEAP